MRTFAVLGFLNGIAKLFKVRAETFVLDPSGALYFTNGYPLSPFRIVMCYAPGTWLTFKEHAEKTTA